MYNKRTNGKNVKITQRVGDGHATVPNTPGYHWTTKLLLSTIQTARPHNDAEET
jgi:hypothetical protein